MRTPVLLLAGVAFMHSPCAGQALIQGPVPSILFSNPTSRSHSAAVAIQPGDSVERDIRPTYWKEGMLVGGLLGAVGGALLGGAFCKMSEEFGKDCSGSVVLGGIVGAGLLAIPGALVGGQFPKDGS